MQQSHGQRPESASVFDGGAGVPSLERDGASLAQPVQFLNNQVGVDRETGLFVTPLST